VADADIRDHFERQARFGDQLGSPFMGRLCRILARDLDRNTETGRRLLDWPDESGAAAVALRLCGGLHSLVLTGVDAELAAVYPPNDVSDSIMADAVRAALVPHDATLGQWLDSAPQTNEIARSAMLLPGFLQIAQETGLGFDLAEIGASAGLNLIFDRFRFDYSGAAEGESEWGDAGSPVQLAPEARGPAPPLGGEIAVARRTGSDIAPVDIADPAQRLRLRAYVWPDQTARLERLGAALGLALESPFALEQANAVDFVERRLAQRLPDAAFVLFHSIMWFYMPEESRRRIEAMLAAAGAQASPIAPIAWLRMEPLQPSDPHATLSLTLWPDGRTRHLARCDYHGRWIEWIG
jgi:hypothetical protein